MIRSRVGGQRQALEELASFAGAQLLRAAADAVMKQRRLDGCIHWVRSSISVCRSLARERH